MTFDSPQRRYLARGIAVPAGAGAGGVVGTSLPAAAKPNLPARDTVTVSGRRYAVRSSHKRAMGRELATIWVPARS